MSSSSPPTKAANAKSNSTFADFEYYPEAQRILSVAASLAGTSAVTAEMIACGFIESGLLEPDMKKAPQLVTAMMNRDAYGRVKSRLGLKRSGREAAFRPTQQLTAEGAAVLRAAEEVATNTRGEQAIAGRDLLYVLFLASDTAAVRLQDLGVSRAAVAEAFRRKVLPEILDARDAWLALLGGSDPAKPPARKSSISDRPRRRDDLAFQPYVTALREFLTSPDTEAPLTVSIEGEWGSGKSSFMLQLEDSIRQSQRNRKTKARDITLTFNAWRHDKDDALWAAFALEFVAGMKRQLPLWRRLVGNVKLLVSRFEWTPLSVIDLARAAALIVILGSLSLLVPWQLWHYVPWSSDLGKVLANKPESTDFTNALTRLLVGTGGLGGTAIALLSVWKLIFKSIGSPWAADLKRHLKTPDYESKVAFVERFHQDFRKTIAAYVGPDRKIFVFIDDLDRCTIPKAADLIQAIAMLVTNDTNVVFLLGMDRDKIAASLAAKYKDVLPYLAADTANGASADANADALRAVQFGSAFLEKFVQIPFLLPRTQPAKIDEFVSRLAARTAAADEAAERQQTRSWWSSFLDRFGKPQRDGGNATGEAETLEAEQVDRLRTIAPSVAADSDRLLSIVKAVAPVLDNNPRRITQFMNIMRLRTYIAATTGRLADRVNNQKRDLTLERIGKIVAIQMMHPRLVADVTNDASIISALHQTTLPADATQSAKYWWSRTQVREIFGIGDAATEPADYDLRGIDTDVLLTL